jgi:hypothetical protein
MSGKTVPSEEDIIYQPSRVAHLLSFSYLSQCRYLLRGMRRHRECKCGDNKFDSLIRSVHVNADVLFRYQLSIFTLLASVLIL